MHGRLYRFVVAVILATSGPAFASLPELPRFRVLSLDHGLPSTSISDIAQGPDGLLWVGTRNGLARFDGETFQTFQNDPADAGSLPYGDVVALHVDSQGRTWISVDNFGVTRLDPGTESFSHVGGPGSPLAGTSVIAIKSTSDGATWFGTRGDGVFRLDETGNWRIFRTSSAKSHSERVSEYIYAIEEDAKSVVWIGSSEGLFRWTGESLRAEDISAPAPSKIIMLHSDAEGLWIGTTHGLRLRDTQGLIRKPSWLDDLPNSLVFSTLVDRFGARWIITRSGLARVVNGVVSQVELAGAANFRHGNNLLEDLDGGIWVAQHGMGLLRLPAEWRNFSTFNTGADRHSTSARWVRALSPAKSGGVWIAGRGGGLDKFEPETGQIARITTEGELGECQALSVLEHSDGSVWIGCLDFRLVRLDLKRGRSQAWTPTSASDALLPGAVEGLHEDADGNVWLEMGRTGFQVRDSTGTVQQNLSLSDDPKLKFAGFARLMTGPDGRVWVSGIEGLLSWDPTNRRFEHVPGTPRSLVYSADFRTDQRIWLSRIGGLEIYRWTGSRLELVRRFGKADGLPNLGTSALVADYEGGAWIATVHGLVRARANDRAIRVFGIDDGLPNAEFDNQRPVITASGLVFAPGASALVAFDTRKFTATAKAPQVSLRVGVRRNDTMISLPSDTETVLLYPSDRDFRVTARIHSLNAPNSRRYRFWLHGYDKSWVDDVEGERVFTRLEHGTYRLEVVASNASGIWSKPKTLEIVVQPAWWQTIWARAFFFLAVVALMLAVASMYRARLRQISATRLLEERRALAEQASQAKSRFLADLGHEIRTPMTGVLGMAELMHADAEDARQRARIEAIQSAGQHLLLLLNDSLDLARIEAGRLELQDVAFDLPALLADACSLVRPQAETKGLTFELHCAPDLPRGVRGDPVRLRQILLNLGNNAVKFTAKGGIVVRARTESGRVLMEVLDTGLGMEQTQLSRIFGRFEQAEGATTAGRFGGSGLGLAICRELAQAMHGDIEAESTLGVGSCFRVVLPLVAVAMPDTHRHMSLHVREPSLVSARVLVVEDDSLVAEVVCSLLASLGHTAQRAAHGLEALTVAASGGFDLVVMDLDLPGLDGFEIARLIRVQGIRVPVVALTARADSKAEALAREAGMVGFLRKPVNGEMLAAAVACHARRQESDAVLA